MKPSMRLLDKLDKAMEHQKTKFGHEPKATPFQFASILGEEFGEICRGINQDKFIDVEKECIQSVAVILAFLDGDLHYGSSA